MEMHTPIFDIPEKFWSDYLELFRNGKPGVIRQPFPTPLATADDIFAGIKEFTRRAKINRNDSRVDMRRYVEGQPVTGELASVFLANSADQNLESYIQRLDRDIPGEFGYILNNYQALDPVSYKHFCFFLSGTYKRQGFPLKKFSQIFLFVTTKKAFSVCIRTDRMSSRMWFRGQRDFWYGPLKHSAMCPD